MHINRLIAFLKLNIFGIFTLNKFWPPRPTPQGFSIEKLARSYKEKIINSTYTQGDFLEQEEEKLVLENYKEDKSKEFKNLKIEKYTHWANRNFYEYKDVA